MDILYTGKKIAELRKEKGLTQKEFAETLHVTDKAVSKWERGLNFPELFTLEKIAQVLDVSVIELLGIENHSNEQLFSDVCDLAEIEKQKIADDIHCRGWITVIFIVILYGCMFYTSKILADNNIYGLPQTLTLGMSGFYGVIFANGFVSLREAKKLRGKNKRNNK